MRTLSLLSVVAAVAVGGYLFLAQTRGPDPETNRVQAAEELASAGVAAANFQSAAIALEAAHATAGTYANARLDGLGVRLARADAASYCLEAGAGATLVHVKGPRGTPEPGPC